MMNRKISILILAMLLLLTSLGGCQLAQPDAGAESDRLVGVYITREHLDLFDLEGYLNDNPELLTGGEIQLDGAPDAYSGRLYATVQTGTLTSDEGERYEDREYVFEGVDGIPMFFARCTDSAGNSYWASFQGDGVSDGSWNLGDKIELSGTIYVTGRRADFYFNPVYQSADGSVYLTAGQGTSGDLAGASSFSHALSESRTVTEQDGETRTEETHVEVTIQGMCPPEQVTVLQMGADGVLLQRDSWTPADLPDSIEPGAETAYLIVETQDADKKITRALYERGEEFLRTYLLGADGICLPRDVQLDWGDSA